MMSDYNYQNAAGVSVKEHLALIARERRFIILFCISAAFTALILTYVYSEKYQSTTTIFYRQADVTVMKARGHEAFGSPATSTPFKVISKTVRELVESEVILRGVVEELNLHVDVPDDSGPWYSRMIDATKDWLRAIRDDVMNILKYGRLIDEDPVVSAIKKLASNIEVVNKDSYVFLLRVRDKHPERVAIIADTISRHLVEFLRQQSIGAGESKKEQIEALMLEKSATIDTASSQLESMLAENNLVSILYETERGVMRLSDLEASRDELTSEIALNEARAATIRRMLAGNVGGAKTYIQPEDKKRLESEKVFTDLELKGLQANLNAVDKSIVELSTLLEKLPALDLEHAKLETELDGARRDWVQLRDALQDAVVRSTQTEGEATVLNFATVPAAPVSPVKLYHVSLATLLSLLTAIALVFVLSFLRLDLFFQTQPQ